MDWLRSKTAVAAGFFALIAFQGYGLMSMRNNVEDRIGVVERDLQAARAQDESKISQLSSALNVVTERMGINAQELKQAQALAEKLKQENTQTAQRLRRELAAKADAAAVKQLHQEATTKLAEVQQDATAKFGAVSGEVHVVRTDLDATRQELASSKKELTGLIAHNRKARHSGVCSEPKPLTSDGLSFLILTAGRHEETKDATKENRVCVLPAPLSLLWDWSCPPKQKKSGAGVFPEASAAARIPAVR